MDNQHRKIKGYRELSQPEINLMNESKELAAKVGAFCEKVKASGLQDDRWLGAAQMDLQKGFMSLTRSVAKPDSF